MTLISSLKQESGTSRTIIWDVSLAMLVIFIATVCVTALLFMFGVSIGNCHFAFAILISFCIIYLIQHKSVRYTLVIVGIAVVLILFLCVISGGVYDTTWDGAAYHKQAVGLLRMGWNPLYQSAGSYESIVHTTPYLAANPIKWAETYPKATWYFAGVMSFIFRNIETGKSYTLIFIFITGGFFYDYLKSKRVKGIWSIVTALLTAFNPISMAQCQSYYLDGLVCSVAMCLMLFLLRSFDAADEHSRAEHAVAVAALLVVGCNLKFSILLLCVLYSFIYMLFCGTLYLKKRCSLRLLVERFCFLLICGLFSVTVVGASPYLTNIHRYGSAFGSFIELLNTPASTGNSGLRDVSNLQLLLASLFGKMSHGELGTAKELLKSPFSIHTNELSYYGYVDTRMGGMGVLFSGALVLSLTILILLIVYHWCHKKKLPDWIRFFCLLGCSTVGYAILLPLTFQLRYIGFIYFFPMFLVIIVMQLAATGKGEKLVAAWKIASVLLCLTLVLNMLPWFAQYAYRINCSVDTTATLQMLQSLDSEKQELQIALFSKDFAGIHYNLQDDFGLKYTYVEYEEIGAIGGFIPTFSDWIYYRIAER